MRYVHGGTISGRVSGSSIVRIVFGAALLSLSFVILNSVEFDEFGVAIIVNCFTCWPGGLLLLLFGIRSLRTSLQRTPRHNAATMAPLNTRDPFFTAKCERCGIVFDYQYSDLGFRAWYREGFVECPRCEQPHRHNATKNAFKEEELLQ